MDGDRCGELVERWKARAIDRVGGEEWVRASKAWKQSRSYCGRVSEGFGDGLTNGWGLLRVVMMLPKGRNGRRRRERKRELSERHRGPEAVALAVAVSVGVDVSIRRSQEGVTTFAYWR